ncbi:MAG: FHA domain-containing protein [Nitratireductor sp.]
MTSLAREIANKGLREALDQYRLIVTGGNHAGASVTRASGTVKLGRNATNDIVLFADALEPEHFRLELPSKVGGKIVLHAIQGSVTVNGNRLVQVGEFADIKSGSLLSAGNCEVKVERIADPVHFAVPALRGGLAVLALIAAFVVWNLVSAMWTIIPAGAEGIIKSVSAPVSREFRGALESTGLTSRKTATAVEPFAWTVRAKLEESGLSRKLRVVGSEDGTLRISGTISDRDSGPWNEFLRWYDGQTEFPQLIREVSRGEDKNDFPPLQSVWLGDRPTAYFQDGTVAGIGATIPGDWVIADISGGVVVLERDGSQIRLTY